MNEKPLVSVVIPTYKRPELVKRAVKSVLNQTYENTEIIVVNDSPETDISEIEQIDERVQLINHQENKGACEARNTGIENAKGKYIGLLDDDDEYLPDKLEKQVKQFQELGEEYGLVYGGVELVENGEVVGEKIRSGRKIFSRKRRGQVYKELLRGNMIPSPTVLVRKEAFEKAGLFDPGFESAQDLDMWIRIAKHYKIGKLDEAIARYHLDAEDRISNSLDKTIQGQQKIYEKHKRDIDQHIQAKMAVQTMIKTCKLQKRLNSKIADEIIRKIRFLGILVSRIG